MMTKVELLQKCVTVCINAASWCSKSPDNTRDISQEVVWRRFAMLMHPEIPQP